MNDKNPNSLNKTKLAKKLQERFSTGNQQMTFTRAAEIVEAIFGVSDREGVRDGIIAEHLRQAMQTVQVEKEIQKNNQKKTFKYKDLVYNKVTFPDFGSFRLHYRASRQGVHPKDQKKVLIDESFVINFQPGKAFKNAFKKGNRPHMDEAMKCGAKAHLKKEEIKKYRSQK